MSRKSKLTVALVIFLLLLIGGMACLAAIYLYLPTYLEKELLPRIAHRAGIKDFSVDVRHVGFFRADLSRIRIGPENSPLFQIQSVQLNYTPQALYRKRVKKAVLRGIEVSISFKDGNPEIHGLPLPVAKQPTSIPAKSARLDLPEIPAESIELRDVLLNFEFKDHRRRIPLDAVIMPANAENRDVRIAANFQIGGQPFSALVELNKTTGRIDLLLEGESMNMEKIGELLPLPDVDISGRADLEGSARLQLNPFKIMSASATIDLANGSAAYRALRVKYPPKSKARPPLRLGVNSPDGRVWNISLSSFTAVAPFFLSFADLSATLDRSSHPAKIAGQFDLLIAEQRAAFLGFPAIHLSREIPLRGKFSGTGITESKWELTLRRTAETASIGLETEGYEIAGEISKFHLTGKQKQGRVQIDCSLKSGNLRAKGKTAELTSGGVSIAGHASLTPEGSAGDIKIQLQQSSGRTEAAKFDLARIDFETELRKPKAENYTAAGRLRFSGLQADLPEFSATLSAGRGNIPFAWPAGASTKRGNIFVAALTYRNRALGEIQSNVQQTSAGFSFEGRHINRLLPELELGFSGRANLLRSSGPPGIQVNFAALRPEHLPAIDLGILLPSLNGLRLQGRLSGKGEIYFDPCGLQGSLIASLESGRLRMNKAKLVVEGLDARLSLPRLFELRSAPNQKIRFSKAAIGDFRFENGILSYHIESPRSLHIEEGHFQWCEGGVDVHSLRIDPRQEDYTVALFCDRLDLTAVLEQFGIASAAGSGALNGRIPLRYREGALSFEDGFLYSTPGQGGSILLRGTEIFTAGIPAGTPQHVQMELAREALKDYDYEWVKLTFNSQGEDLLVRMQLDGKPAAVLPFTYKPESGRFVRIAAGAQGSRFQGIRLDVNFRLPLNKILRYKDLLKMIR